MLRGILFILISILFSQCNFSWNSNTQSEEIQSLEIVFPKGANCIACQLVIHRVTTEFAFDSIIVFTEEMREIEKNTFTGQFKMDNEQIVEFVFDNEIYQKKKMTIPDFYKFGLVIRKSGKIITRLTGESYNLNELYKQLKTKE